MSRLYLTSEVQYVASSLKTKLADVSLLPAVFITTPINDKPHSDLSWHHRNRVSLENLGFSFDFYNISNKTNDQIVGDLARYAVMYVEGGNSYYLLQEAQKNGFGELVAKKVKEGMVYIGTSAGSVIVGPDIEPVRREETTPLAPELKGTKAFGIVTFVVMPHWGDPNRRALYNDYRMEHIYHEDYPYVFISNNQYVEVVEGSWKIITVKN